MPGLVADLVDELRAVGIPISVGEHIDAASAVASVPLQEKEVLRAALQGALVKTAEHLSAFNLIFDLYTSGRSQAADSDGDGGGTPLSDLSDEELRDALRDAMGGDDDLLQSVLADEYVRRFADMEPGRPVAGVMYGLQVNQAADLEGIREDLLQRLGDGDQDGEGAGGGGGTGGGGGGGGGGGRSRSRGGTIEEGLPGVRSLRDRLARGEIDRAIDKFRDEIEASIRRALVADRGARAVRQTMRVGLAEDADIATASSAELAAMAKAIGPLAQQLTQVLNQQAVFRKRKLSIRGTLRKAMGSGGIPFRIATEPARPPKPDIVVLCDVSGSVASFSRFTLALLIALDSRLQPAARVLLRRRGRGHHRDGPGGAGLGPAAGRGADRAGVDPVHRQLGLRAGHAGVRGRAGPAAHPPVGRPGRGRRPVELHRPVHPRLRPDPGARRGGLLAQPGAPAGLE